MPTIRPGQPATTTHPAVCADWCRCQCNTGSCELCATNRVPMTDKWCCAVGGRTYVVPGFARDCETRHAATE